MAFKSLKKVKPKPPAFSRDAWYINYPAYHILWRKRDRYLPRLAYVMLPFIMITILGAIILGSDAHKEGEKFYSFFQDYTNCFMICYVFFFMYFINGLVVYHFNKKTDLLLDKMKAFSSAEKEKKAQYKKTVKLVSAIFSAIYLLFIVGSPFFIVLANKAGKAGEIQYWYSKIGISGLIYYGVIIGIAWVLTARLFVSILINAIVIYKVSRNQRLHFNDNENRKDFLKPLLNHLAASLGFGVYFLIAVAMILYSDIRAHDMYKMDFGVYSGRWYVIAITLLLSAFYFSTVILSYVSVTSIISNNDLGGTNGGKNRKVDATSFGVFLLTVILPGFAAMFQILAPLWKWANLLNL